MAIKFLVRVSEQKSLFVLLTQLPVWNGYKWYQYNPQYDLYDLFLNPTLLRSEEKVDLVRNNGSWDRNREKFN